MAEGTIFQFQADLKAFSEAVGVTIASAVRKIALELLTAIVMKTPVRSGRARASWMLSLRVPSQETLPEGQYGYDLGYLRAQIGNLKQLTDNDPFQIVWISNSLDYIEALEHGHSRQAPAGMVAVSIAEMEAAVQYILDSEAQRLNRQN